MPIDEELESLVRARRTSPDDPGLALRHALALGRTGEAAAAEKLLVAALDAAPGEGDLTAALDRATGGRAVGAPWPSSAGNARRSRRSSAVGPSRGEVVLRRELLLDSPVRSFVVGPGGVPHVLTGSALYALDRDGDARVLEEARRDFGYEYVVLLPAGRIVLVGASHALTLLGPTGGAARRVHRQFSLSSFHAVGASGLLYVASRQGRVDGYRVSVPGEARTICRTEHDKTGLAIAPGGDLVVAIEGSQRKNRTARLLRVDPLGAPRFEVELKERSFGRSLQGPVVGEDGTVFLGFPGLEVFAYDAAGEVVFEAPYVGAPFALAGERGELLVTREDRSLHLLDARTGAVEARWEGSHFGPPIVDARGWVYARRGDDLVGWDPYRPGKPALEVPDLAKYAWEFALAGDGRILVVPLHGAEAASELVVVE
jgi:outer membrane protein assembly factor BamB